MKKYHYFISYAHGTGFGNAEHQTDTPIKNIADVQRISREFEKEFSTGRIVIMNYQLLQQYAEPVEDADPVTDADIWKNHVEWYCQDCTHTMQQYHWIDVFHCNKCDSENIQREPDTE